MTDVKLKSEQIEELQELINRFTRSGDALTKAYTVLLEQHTALTMVMGALVGCFRALDPHFGPRWIAGLETIAAERGEALTDGQREFLGAFASAVMIEPGEPGEAGAPKGVATH
jgi:hypothetical protein